MRYNLYNNFSVYHKERPRHYKRHIEPLSDVEYSHHLFRWPTQPVGSAYQVPGNICKGVSHCPRPREAQMLINSVQNQWESVLVSVNVQCAV